MQGEKISVHNQGDVSLEGVDTGFLPTEVPELYEVIPGELLEVPGAAHDEHVGEEIDLGEGKVTIELLLEGNSEEADHGLKEVVLKVEWTDHAANERGGALQNVLDPTPQIVPLRSSKKSRL